MPLQEDNPVRENSVEESRQTTWLSCGLETLVHQRPWMGDRTLCNERDYDFDVVIVGSGYGGAVAAAELSGCTDENDQPLRICVLERGREYLAGSFPSRQAELAGHVRFVTPNAARQRGAHGGLFDVRWSDDAVALVASGLGGGSLINAGVMEMPKAEVFREARWPHAIRSDNGLGEMAERLRPWLGAHALPNNVANTLTKTSQLNKLAGGPGKASLTRITVAAEDGPNKVGVKLKQCLLCGDCATGCNSGAKNSLDLNLFVLAQGAGAQIVTGATVLRIAASDHDAGGWLLYVNHTDNHLRDRQPEPFRLNAKRVILAAGTFGSTEILLRSRGQLQFSAQLGRKFSANGDMLVIAHDLTEPVNAVANETQDPAPPRPGQRGARAIGPTITAMIDLRDGNPDTDLVIQDLAVPGPLRRLFEESTTTFDVLNQLGKGDWSAHRGDHACADDAALNPSAMKNSLVLAMIGRDNAEGELSLGDRPICDDADGLLTVRWPELRLDRRFDDHHRRLKTMLSDSRVGGRVVNNLLWRPFSDLLERLFEPQRGPLVTVHPLGGCAMGEDVRQGVTDHCGRVFNASGHDGISVHQGLVVLDGSIVPTSLGINPALTIAVLAFRAVTQLKAEWKVKGGQLIDRTAKAAPTQRPLYAIQSTITNPKPTLIELTEQVRGCVKLRTRDGRRKPHQLELTLTTEPAAVTNLIAHQSAGLRGFSIARGKGKLTILKTGTNFDLASDQAKTDRIALEAEVSGELRLFALEASNPCLRTARAVCAWFVNRGLRDGVQSTLQFIQEQLHLRPRPDEPKHNTSILRQVREFVWGILVVCSRAGAARLIEYNLHVDKILSATDFDPATFDGRQIRGVKRLTYARGASPFTQLLGMSLETCPQMRKPIIGKFPKLELNKRFLARQGVPLLRVVGQQDGVTALIDLLSLALYMLRVVVQVHALSFRRPDAPPARAPRRLPGKTPGLPVPEIDWLTADGQAKPPVRIRLTRYNGARLNPANVGPTRPVLLIHGYSASGTTFAHPEVPGNLAQTLYEAGRDVWVLDMRCSAGLPSATGDWPFEVMADQDIPLAIEHVLAAANTSKADGVIQKLDIVAHCMGAAMFSMAVLGDGQRQERLHDKIGRVVFSQVGPAMMLSGTNVLAAYIMRYARRFLPFEEYAFSPQGEISLAGQLLDRALAAMKMPSHEYRRENPFWLPGKATPWVGTRHRMDAIYGRTFSLKNISKGVLHHLDDFFGPISVETLSQVIHFAAYNTVTDRRGINDYVMPSRISQRLNFPMMSIHGEDNGLIDVATLALMRNTLEKAGVPHLNAMSDGVPPGRKDDPVTKSQTAQEVEQLIDKNSAAFALGQPSYLTWRISGHGHQDCLIGKDAQAICRVIAKYLGTPDKAANISHWPTATIKKLNHASAYQAIAPAFGMRVRVEADKIVVQACDSAGRGPPRRALLVPVKQQGDRLCMPNGIPTSHIDLENAGVAIVNNLRQDVSLPYLFEVPRGSWPSNASEVLVLLLYDQAEGIGGSPRPPGRMMDSASQAKSPIARAITEALSYDTIDDLRGGLIRGSLIDQQPQGRVTFALASCLYPSDILNHMPVGEHATRGPPDASLLALGDLLGKPDAPTLLLLAGDQIYADATAGLFDPKVLDERYRIPHERRGESRGAKAVMQRLDLDVQMMIDDHEINDNWAPNDPDPEQLGSGNTAIERGRSAYFLYERALLKFPTNVWYKLVHKGLPFFLADARTEREGRTALSLSSAQIMRPGQFQELCEWLIAPAHGDLPKFVLTASALLPRRLSVAEHPASALQSDAWEGYPSSLNSLLKFICDNEIKGVVFLSGDEHLSNVVKASVTCDDTKKHCTLHSIHSSALYAPYPFANGSPEDFIANDTFTFCFREPNGVIRRYQCQAETQFFPGDGFALLVARHSSPNWYLDVRFHDEIGPKDNGDVKLQLM